MEDLTNTGLTSTATATSPLHNFLRRPSKKALLLTSIALTVVVFFIMIVMNFSLVMFAVSTNGTHIETVEKGVPTWYKFSFGMAKNVDGAPGFDKAPVTVLEAIPYGAEGEYAVLARISGVEGIAVGILHTNNTFENILSDATNKADLAVRPDGLALFGVMIDGESHLMLLDLTKSGAAPSNLGRGRSPRVFTDGFFVAISSRGIVRIDPTTKSVSVLVPSNDADIYNGTISKEGTRAAISNTSSKTLLYRIEQTSPGNVALMSTSRFTALSPISFVGTEFIIEPSAHQLSVYHITPAFKNVGSLRVK